MKKRVLALCLAVVMLLSAISLTAIFGTKKLLSLPTIGEHFTKEKQKFTLTVNTTAGGSVNTAGGEYEEGNLVNLTATPEEGYVFYGWYDGKNTYLTTSTSYSLVMNGDTTLYAKFGEKPQDMAGHQEYFTHLRDCSADFAFTVQCDEENPEEYLQDNLVIIYEDLIGTDYAGMDEAYVPFEIEKQSENQFLIKPTTQYDAGTTFVATLRDQLPSGEVTPPEDGTEPEDETGSDGPMSSVIFLDTQNGDNSLTFTIEQENTEVMEVGEGVIFLSRVELALVVDDGLTEGDEGDAEDYLICSDLSGMHEDSIICIYDLVDEDGQPVIDEATIYGKVKCIVEDNGIYTVYYGMPELYEIYENLDIFQSEEINLEDQCVEISEDVLESIRYELFTDEAFQEYIAIIEQVLRDKYENDEYDMEFLSAQNFLDHVDVKIVPKISGNTATIDMTASFNISLNKKGSQQKAQLNFQLNIKQTVKVSAFFNFKLKYFWFIPTGVKSYDIGSCVETENSTSFGVYIGYDTGSAGLDDLDKYFNQEAIRKDCLDAFNGSGSIITSGNIKDIFTQNGYSSGSRRNISLFKLSYYMGVVTVNVDVKFFIDLDISGSLYYTSTSTNCTVSGIRSGYGKYVQNQSSSSTSDMILSGSLGVKSGLCAECYFSIVGLSKYIQVGIGLEIGAYLDTEGYVSLMTGHHAGYMEVGVYFEGYAYCKLFSFYAKYDFVKETLPLLRFGYNQSLLSYVYGNEIAQGEVMIATQSKEDISLFESEALRIWVYNAGEEISQDYLSSYLDRCPVEVIFADGRYLYYEDGKLKIREDAPAYFKDRIQITVYSENKWQSCQKDTFCSYLDTIEIEFVYGDEDRYYEQTDSSTEKEFRRLFRNYNDANVVVLQSSFRHLIEQNLIAGSDQISKYEELISEYVDQTFAVIKTYRLEEDEDRTKENQFVYNESKAFNAMIDFVNKAATEKNLTEQQAYEFVLIVESSAVLRGVVDSVVEQGSTVIAEQLSLSEDIKNTVKVALERYERDSSDPVYAKEFADKVKQFLDLE